MKNTLNNAILIACATIGLFSPIVYAQSPTPVTLQNSSTGKYTALEALPCIPDGVVIKASDCPGGQSGALQNQFEFRTYIQYIFNLAIALAAAAAVFMIIWNGFQYMTVESWTGKGDAKKNIQNSLLGLLLILCSYLILRTVDPRLVAIPSSLVEPLHLAKPDYGLGNFFSEMEKDLLAYKADMATITSLRNEANATGQRLSGEIDSIDDQIRAASGQGDLTEAEITSICKAPPDSLKTLCQQRNAKVDELNTSAQKVIFATGIAVMRATVQQCGYTTAQTQCWANQGDMAKLDNILNDYVAKLDPAYQNDFRKYYTFANGWHTLNGIMNSIVNGGTFNGTRYTWQQWDNFATPLAARVKAAVDGYAASPYKEAGVASDMQTRYTELKKNVDSMTTRLKTADQVNNRPSMPPMGY